jgi:branched-subunit amino acid transport protein
MAVTWFMILSLAAGAFACKLLGLVVIGVRDLPPIVDRCLTLIPAALISPLIVKDRLSIGQDLVLDARAAGVGVAAVASWRRAPLVIVIALGAAVTAIVRTSG